jgi:hypothetical protein
MFRHAKAANGVANIATPIFFNNKVFFTSAYGAGGGLFDLSVRDGEVAANEVYHTTEMRRPHSDLFEFASGKMTWRGRSVGKGSVTYADGHLYIQGRGQPGRTRRGDAGSRSVALGFGLGLDRLQPRGEPPAAELLGHGQHDLVRTGTKIDVDRVRTERGDPEERRIP